MCATGRAWYTGSHTVREEERKRGCGGLKLCVLLQVVLWFKMAVSLCAPPTLVTLQAKLAFAAVAASGGGGGPRSTYRIGPDMLCPSDRARKRISALLSSCAARSTMRAPGADVRNVSGSSLRYTTASSSSSAPECHIHMPFARHTPKGIAWWEGPPPDEGRDNVAVTRCCAASARCSCWALLTQAIKSPGLGCERRQNSMYHFLVMVVEGG